MQQTQTIAQLRAPANASGGLPTRLAEGIAELSGEDLSDVRVHAASGRPAQLNAEAFAQGRDIHLAPGQERHLAHEAWHIVQQRQGRVRPTADVSGQPVNDDPRLEREADAMGQRALTARGGTGAAVQRSSPSTASAVVQQKGGGKGGSGGGRARGPSQIPKRNKPADEQRRREAIGRHQARNAPPVRRRQQAQQPEPRPGGAAPGGGPGARGQQHQPRGPLFNPPGDHVVIDIPDDEHAAQEPEQAHGWRGVARRVGAKAFAGRTFGDVSNSLGASANLVPSDETVTASTLLVIGSAGVLTNGLKLMYDGVKQYNTARNRRQKREATVTATTGLANLLSGIYGLESGILNLAGESNAASTVGVISTAAWAISELLNIAVQAEVLIRNLAGRKPWRSYVKPGLAMLASLFKCLGAVLYVSAAIANASVEDADEHPGIGNTNTVAIWAMFAGAVVSVLHGAIKLSLVLRSEMRASREQADRDDDEDENEDDLPIDLELGLAHPP